jgi:plasmid maintenance system killer protein
MYSLRSVFFCLVFFFKAVNFLTITKHAKHLNEIKWRRYRLKLKKKKLHHSIKL